jgi:hypothetical protein
VTNVRLSLAGDALAEQCCPRRVLNLDAVDLGCSTSRRALPRCRAVSCFLLPDYRRAIGDFDAWVAFGVSARSKLRFNSAIASTSVRS